MEREARGAVARERLARFKVPRFKLVAELPKSATGTMQKHVSRGGRAPIARQ